MDVPPDMRSTGATGTCSYSSVSMDGNDAAVRTLPQMSKRVNPGTYWTRNEAAVLQYGIGIWKNGSEVSGQV